MEPFLQAGERRRGARPGARRGARRVGAGFAPAPLVALALTATVPPVPAGYATPVEAVHALRDARSAEGTPGQQAEQQARQMLSRLLLPPGARAVPSLPAALARPFQSIAAGSQLVRLTRRYVVARARPAALASFFESHVPEGSSASGRGTSTTFGDVTTWAVTFTPERLRPAVYQAQLVVTIAAARGGSALRADAEVAYEYPHPADLVVPQTVPSARVERTLLGHRRPLEQRAVAGRALRAIVGAFDAAPVAPPGAWSCPADFGVRLVATFAKTATSPALTAVVGNCSTITVSTPGRGGAVLRDRGGRWSGALAEALAGALGFHGYGVWRPAHH